MTETRDVLSQCPKAGWSGYHNWMASKHSPRWTVLETFCNRCHIRGTFTPEQLQRWHTRLENNWEAYLQDRRDNPSYYS